MLIEFDLGRRDARDADPEAFARALAERLSSPRGKHPRLDPVLEGFGARVVDVMAAGDRRRLLWEAGSLRPQPDGPDPSREVGPESEVRIGEPGSPNRDD